jgi:RNA polymerase sigma factor (sigma-70 family)
LRIGKVTKKKCRFLSRASIKVEEIILREGPPMARGQLHSVLHYIRRLAGARGDGLADGQLLERFQTERDEAAFEVLVWRHGPMVFGLCRRMLRDEQAAEDALQATFLTLARKAGSVSKRSSIASWLHKVAYRIALRAQADAAKRARHEKALPVLPAVEVPGEAEKKAVGAELRALLDDELNRLPERYRVPVVLCWLEGKTHEEAAGELSWAKGTVATRLSRSRELLRMRLVKRGIAVPAAAFTAVLAEQTTSAAIPAPLVAATRKAALAFAAGEATGTVSSQAIIFTDGALRTMFMTKLKWVTAAALLVGAIGTGARFAYPVLFEGHGDLAKAGTSDDGAQEKITDQRPATWQQRVGLHGHRGSTTPLFSPDSKTLATVGGDGFLRFWDTATWQELGSFNMKQRYAVYTAYPFWSPDSKTVAVYGGVKVDDGPRVPEVTLLDPITCKPVRTISGYNPHFSPDGNILATRLDEKVKLWDYRTGDERAALQAGVPVVGMVNDAIFSADGKTLATAAADRTVKLWDVASGKERAHLPGYSPAFSPDGKFLATALLDRTIKLWEAATGKECTTLGRHTFPYIDLAFSPDSKLLASWGTIYGLAAGEQLKTLHGPPAKRRLELKLWSVPTGKEVIALPGWTFGDSSARFSPDGKTPAYDRMRDRGKERYVVLWDLVQGNERATIQSAATDMLSASFSPDGRWVWTNSPDGLVELWNPVTGRQITVLHGDKKRQLSAVVFSPDSHMLAVTEYYNVEDPNWWENGVTEVTIWQLSKEQLVKESRSMPSQKKEPPKEAAKATPPEKKPATPAGEYQALLQEYGNGLSEFGKAFSKAKADAERKKLDQELRLKLAAYADRALALARKYPKDPAAVDALSLVVQLSLGPGAEEAKRKAVALDLLLRDYLQSDKLPSAFALLTHLPSQASEDFLRAALAKSPSGSVQGQACYHLAACLQIQADTVLLLKQQPDLAKKAEKMWGTDLLKELQGRDATQLGKEAEQLYERVRKEYRDVPNGTNTLGNLADSALFALRHLAIGKPAPEIEGEDIDGKPLRLSDYRGKVVVLDFWGHW